MSDGSGETSTTRSAEGQLTGRLAVVTGGGRGLGAEIARRLAAEGASVAVAARSADELDETVRGIVEVGGRSTAYPMDVSDANAVQEMVALVERDLGGRAGQQRVDHPASRPRVGGGSSGLVAVAGVIRYC